MEKYVFFIGGSGARVYSSFIHASAAGILQTKKVSVLLIDADQANAANVNSIELYRKYKKVYEMLQNKDSGSFSCDIHMESETVLSPVKSNAVTLADEVGHLDDNRVRMLEALYTEEEMQQDLRGGFYAHPNIGCVFFSDFQSEEFDTCLQKIEHQLDNDQNVRIALVGSIFGGTGAAGIPTLHKLINAHLKNHKNYNRLEIGGIFLTPYFQVEQKKSEDDGNIFIDMEAFGFNTYEALSYYQTNADMNFQSIYLIGQQEPDIVNSVYADSGKEQDNKAHIVELYAALAIDCFFYSEEAGGVFGYVRKEPLDWQGFPNAARMDDMSQRMRKLADFARAQFVLTSEVYPYINFSQGRVKDAGKKYGILIPQWYQVYHVKQGDVQAQIKKLEAFSFQFIKWLYMINSKYGAEGTLIPDENIQLFGDMLQDVYWVSETLQDRAEPEGVLERLKKLRAGFNEFVNTASNIEYVCNKLGVLMSVVGVTKVFSTKVGAVELLLKILFLTAKRKKVK